MDKQLGNTIAETPAFTRRAAAIWSWDELDHFKSYIALNPLAGDEIPKTGGLRKIRWGKAGKGKRGGVRVIYYFYNKSAPIYLFDVYEKASKSDLTPHEKEIYTKLAATLKAELKLLSKGD